MAEAKKVLLFLNADSEFNRLLRRFVMIFIFGGISYFLKDYIPIAPEWSIPLLTALFALIDKWLRDKIA